MSNSTTTTPLRWGILGAGRIARTFARGVQESRTGTVLAVGSRSQESADKFGDEFNLEAAHRHASYDALLADADVDAVYIATPHPGHAEWAIKAAEAGMHILCEKPLTLTGGEAMQVVQAAQNAGVILMEAFMYRCHPQTARVVDLIQTGAIGEVKVIHASFSFQTGFNPESRLYNNELGGGGILDVGCYAMSMARLIAGAAQGKPFAEPRELQGLGRVGESGVDEYAVANLKFPGDIVAQIATGIGVSQENAVRIFGTKGSIYIPSPWIVGPTDGAVKIIVQRGGEREEVVVDTDRPLYAYEADVFAQSVAAGKVVSPAMSPEDTLGNMQALDRWRAAVGVAYAADRAETNRPIRGELKRRPKAPMTYGDIKGLGKQVSRLIMGCDNQQSFAHAAAMFDDYFEQGGNCFDTAYIYGGGLQERLLGRWVQSRGVRDEVALIAKGAHTPDCHPEALSRQLLQSLERLGVEGTDLYLMHRDNPEVPVGEFVEVLNHHVREGHIKVFGGSNWSLERVQAANDYAAQKGLQGFGVVSNNLSLARMVDPVWKGCISASDAESRAWLEKTQTPLLAWSSQARGFFVRGDRNFTEDDQLVRCWYSEDNFERLNRARELAEHKQTTPINVAAAYVLNQPFPTFALIGPRIISETHSSLPALSVSLAPEERRWLNLESDTLGL